jgi:hypothetical protein
MASPLLSELETFLVTPPEKRDPKKVTAVVELGKEVDQMELSPSMKRGFADHREIFLLKYLCCQKWNVADSAKMVRHVAQHRLSKDLDSTPLFPSSMAIRGYNEAELRAAHGSEERKKGELDQICATMACAYSGAWHKWDKLGRPIYYERTGHIKVRQYVALSKRLTPPGGDITYPSMMAHIHVNEVGGAVMTHINDKRAAEGKPAVSQCVVILDAHNLGLGHLYKPGLNLLRATSDHDAEFYPEGMSKIYVVNTPAMVSVAWAIIKPWLPAEEQKKVVFVKPAHTKEKLLELIDAENLPSFLGGECNCEGQCVPDVLPDSEIPDTVDGEEIAVTDEIQISRGRTTTKSYAIKEGETIYWDFATEGYDISLKIFLSGQEVESVNRASSAGGSFALPPGRKDGDLQFIFDNSYSWIHSKVVQLRISRVPSTESPVLQ